MANKHEIFNGCKERIENQLRIHWKMLKEEDDYKKVFQFIELWMNQALKILGEKDETK